MKHLRPEQIFVMDNATFLDPPDNTREVLAEADLHEVNYSESCITTSPITSLDVPCLSRFLSVVL